MNEISKNRHQGAGSGVSGRRQRVRGYEGEKVGEATSMKPAAGGSNVLTLSPSCLLVWRDAPPVTSLLLCQVAGQGIHDSRRKQGDHQDIENIDRRCREQVESTVSPEEGNERDPPEDQAGHLGQEEKTEPRQGDGGSEKKNGRPRHEEKEHPRLMLPFHGLPLFAGAPCLRGPVLLITKVPALSRGCSSAPRAVRSMQENRGFKRKRHSCFQCLVVTFGVRKPPSGGVMP